MPQPITDIIGTLKSQIDQRVNDHLESGKLYQGLFDEAIAAEDYLKASAFYPEAIINYSHVIAFRDIEELMFGSSNQAQIKEMYRVIERSRVRLESLRQLIEQTRDAAASAGIIRHRKAANG